MSKIIVPLISGFLFGLGLLVSGMNNPAKVQAFLDATGDWQSELMAVMGSAVIVFGIAFKLSEKMKAPWFHNNFHRPSLNDIDGRLLVGAGMFGVGWGLVGLCPGPALLDVMSGNAEVLVFVLSLLIGNRLAHRFVGPAK